VFALVLALGLAALSRGHWRAHRGFEAVLRLTWSVRPERIETCRQVSEAEQADRPAHMREAVVCEGSTATYRLRVWRDDQLLDDEVLRGGGLRNDRPIYLLRDYPASPGTWRLQVEMRRVEMVAEDSTGSAAADQGMSLDRGVRETEERARRRAEAVPAELRLDETVAVGPRQVVLVTWDAEARRLRVVK
jgi:hypothetical protein